MSTTNTPAGAADVWDQLILDGQPPVAGTEGMGCLVTADFEGNGRRVIIVGGFGNLLWYDPHTGKRGTITPACCHVGMAAADVDGDGRPEIIVGQVVHPEDPAKPYVPDSQFGGKNHYMLAVYKPTGSLDKPWKQTIVDPDMERGGPHDITFADVDGDGRGEIVANFVSSIGGVYIYRQPSKGEKFWPRHVVQDQHFDEGLDVADLDGDGKPEIVSGVHWYKAPPAGPYTGPWHAGTIAPGFREMVRLAVIDVNGDGRPDVVMVESENLEGRMSWYENRPAKNGGIDWVEHPIDHEPIYYGHSLGVRKEGNQIVIFLGEMAGGGWFAPYNYQARLMEYRSADGGGSWSRKILYRGAGTHEADVVDLDGSGVLKIVGKEWRHPKVHIFEPRPKDVVAPRFKHRIIDHDKPETATDILAADVDGDGRQDVVCGTWWYQAPTWKRHPILPKNISQVISAVDLDHDGKAELIAILRKDGIHGYGGLSSDLVWLKAIDPTQDRWDVHTIGVGAGDWPHGNTVAPLLSGGRLALVTAYHSATESSSSGIPCYPELFEIPDNPTKPWPKRTLAQIVYGEQLAAVDVNGDGRLDLFAGPWWLENLGNGDFKPHKIVDTFDAARLGVADIDGDGLPDLVMGEQVLDFQKKVSPFSRLAWFKNPGRDRCREPWPMQVIDRLRCPHSIGVADLDGDGLPEIVAAEHDPFYQYRSQSRTFIYKPDFVPGSQSTGDNGSPHGTLRGWRRYRIEDRFEQHDGTQIIDLGHERPGIISHGWKDNRYVHLWEPI
ncbi:MAG: VCBS repeat-containing protein [Phycisphaeraceae bacterium]|nr:VCBS repeat-containing protein [Phycisphaeraceae bacterium]